MLIISKRTDYYDHFSKIYGEDTNVVLDRRVKLDDIKLTDMDKDIHETLDSMFSIVYQYNRRNINNPIHAKILVYCGDLYLLASEDHENYQVVQHNDYFYKKLLIKDNKHHWYWQQKEDIDKETNQLIFDDREISYWNRADLNDINVRMKLYNYIKTPYFTISHCSKKDNILFVDEAIPNLKDIGFSSFNEPFDVYKQINGFITTHLIDSPDKNPPVKVSNNIKIEKAGFDTKTSFRNGKNK